MAMGPSWDFALVKKRIRKCQETEIFIECPFLERTHKIGHSDEVLDRQGTSDVLPISECSYGSKMGLSVGK